MAEDEHVEITEFKEPTILLSIGKSLKDGRSIYDAARFAWRVNPEKVTRSYRLVLAHSDGRVVGAYRPTEWLEANHRNFPGPELRMDPQDEFTNWMPGRYGFTGKCAKDVWNFYVGKRVPEKLRRSQNPVRYCKPTRS